MTATPGCHHISFQFPPFKQLTRPLSSEQTGEQRARVDRVPERDEGVAQVLRHAGDAADVRRGERGLHEGAVEGAAEV